ncbi:hypothetical protein RF11_01858 [Thelohanellus kitauei]|uniref:Uncharacterized protein n=1 Tax=Thelohanellus kitauei TaxID=669202 RepID=A0A0C2ICR1_THEKT|nr:hypothetical protein RF11_01858 [Thelohanellus kitauei]
MFNRPALMLTQRSPDWTTQRCCVRGRFLCQTSLTGIRHPISDTKCKVKGDLEQSRTNAASMLTKLLPEWSTQPCYVNYLTVSSFHTGTVQAIKATLSFRLTAGQIFEERWPDVLMILGTESTEKFGARQYFGGYCYTRNILRRIDKSLILAKGAFYLYTDLYLYTNFLKQENGKIFKKIELLGKARRSGLEAKERTVDYLKSIHHSFKRGNIGNIITLLQEAIKSELIIDDEISQAVTKFFDVAYTYISSFKSLKNIKSSAGICKDIKS